ncbi:hypothetical protein [Streptomyces sp. C-3]
MESEVVAGLIGLGGAIVGGAASLGATWLTLAHGRKQAREARLFDIGQTAADRALEELIRCGEFLGSPERSADATTSTDETPPYLTTALGFIKNVELAITRIPDHKVYERLMIPLGLTRRWRVAGPRHFFSIRWIGELTEDMIEVLTAYVRHDNVPPLPTDIVEKQSKVRDFEERRARHFEALRADLIQTAQRGDDAADPS